MRGKENTDHNYLYFDITKQERDSALRYLLGAIIKCRNDSGFPSNYYDFDEDVNIYLAHLLFAVSLPEYHEMAEPYLSNESSEVMRWVQDAEDQTVRYFIFKVNADHLLVHSAVFNDLNNRERSNFFKNSHKYYRELARLYYDQAACYHRRIYRKKTGVGDVLQKISNYFEAYQTVLKKVRREYFYFLNNFRDQAFHCFMEDVSHYEKEFLKKHKMDLFLDLYGSWLRTKDMTVEQRIKKVVDEIKALDPQFHFNPAEVTGQEGGFFDERKCA